MKLTLSRDFRAHNLNVPEMRLLYSLRCADPGIFVRGGEGGGEARLPKNNRNNIIFNFNPQQILQFYRGVQYFSGGVQLFPGGGVQMLISIKKHITCDFPEGSGPSVPPLNPRMFEQSLPLEVSTSIPESLSLPLDVHKSIQSPRHCNSRLVKVSRVPVIATRGQEKYPEFQSLPQEFSMSIKRPCHCQ